MRNSLLKLVDKWVQALEYNLRMHRANLTHNYASVIETIASVDDRIVTPNFEKRLEFPESVDKELREWTFGRKLQEEALSYSLLFVAMGVWALSTLSLITSRFDAHNIENQPAYTLGKSHLLFLMSLGYLAQRVNGIYHRVQNVRISLNRKRQALVAINGESGNRLLTLLLKNPRALKSDVVIDEYAPHADRLLKRAVQVIEDVQIPFANLNFGACDDFIKNPNRSQVYLPSRANREQLVDGWSFKESSVIGRTSEIFSDELHRHSQNR